MNEDNTITYDHKQRIISQGEKATRAFIITDGKAHIFLEKDGKIVTLAHLEPGTIFGETALFEGAQYGAHVEADESCTVEVITPDSFESKLQNCDPIIQAILQMLSDRLRSTNTALVESETREYIEIALI